MHTAAAMSHECSEAHGDPATMALLQTWMERLRSDDLVIEQAEEKLVKIREMQARTSAAQHLRQEAVEQRAEAQRQADLLHQAVQQWLASRTLIKSRQGEAVKAADESLLNSSSIYAELELLFGPKEMARLAATAATEEKEVTKRKESPVRRRGSVVDGGGGHLSVDHHLAPAPAGAVINARLEPQRAYPGLDALDHSPDEKYIQGPSGKVYAGTALWCLRPGQHPRKWFVRLAEGRWFDPLILLTILLNCATMAWESPLDSDGTPKAAFLAICEWVFLAIFTCEMLVKIMAYGFIGHREAYLHDPWCQLDFTVVTLAWLPILFPNMANYSVLRAFRALRPLRALKRVPGMPMLVQWILSVLPKMGNVFLLSAFIFLIFAIVGMELFKGLLHYRCALPGLTETAGHPISEIRRLSELSSQLEHETYSSTSYDGLSQPAHTSQSSISDIASGAAFALRRSLEGALVDASAVSSQEAFDTGVACTPARADSVNFGCEECVAQRQSEHDTCDAGATHTRDLPPD